MPSVAARASHGLATGWRWRPHRPQNGRKALLLPAPTFHNHSLFYLLYDSQGLYDEAARHAIDPAVVEAFQKDIRRYNAFTRVLQQFAKEPNTQTLYLEMNELTPVGEIAAIVRTEGTPRNPRSVVYRRIGPQEDPEAATSYTVDSTSSLYELLHYVGFHPIVPTLNRQFVDASNLAFSKGNPYGLTLMEWTARRLLTEDRFRVLDRLGCEYIVDAYCREMEARLKYIARNKRAERQRENMFELEKDDSNLEGCDKIRLPSTFLGSPAWTTKKTAEVLTLARKLGPPHFLITATLNPKWPEMVQLLKGSNAQLDPILACRVFRQRLQKLFAIIRK
jgi:hypothetical protein